MQYSYSDVMLPVYLLVAVFLLLYDDVCLDVCGSIQSYFDVTMSV
jgi:hypothetical protein